ncbi:exosome complex component MTR3-like [Haliotis rubra]|uniref:exosome complex component MTR3-like n=1 Tax=Haliotis rubra TaxID=36100 RepID=UPI001EE60598|nr:exosome complex component MTR3-like [Haliotis rubra]
MPTDTRRLTGPEGTISPYSLAKNDPHVPVTDGTERADGRKPDKVRPLFLRAGLITQARGSAYIEQNETKVICSVYGPREVVRKEDFSMKGQLTCEFKFATFSCHLRRKHQQDSEEKDFSVQLLEALEPAVCLHKFPKSQVNVYVMVLQNAGSALAASITCAALALADAGIEMYDLVTGCSARVRGDTILLDPTESEEYKPELTAEKNNGSVTVGLMPSLNQVSAITSKGEIDFQLATKAIKDCVETCQRLYPVLQQALETALKQRLKDADTG